MKLAERMRVRESLAALVSRATRLLVKVVNSPRQFTGNRVTVGARW